MQKLQAVSTSVLQMNRRKDSLASTSSSPVLRLDIQNCELTLAGDNSKPERESSRLNGNNRDPDLFD